MCKIYPASLKCEYLVNPLGVDIIQPRLSWILKSNQREQRQTAYQVFVASSPELLRQNKDDLWNSGKVCSEESIHVVYAGRKLTSGTQCFWKVRVWDAEGNMSPWSEAAMWSMGLLNQSDWKASWITDRELVLFPDAYVAAPATMLRKVFIVDGKIQRATVYVTARGVYELKINGQPVGNNILAPEWTEYDRRIQYQVYDVTNILRKGHNAVGAILGEGWYAGRIGLVINPGRHIYGSFPQFLLQMEIKLAGRRKKRILTDRTWQSTMNGPIRSSDIFNGEVYDARREITDWDQPGFKPGSDWYQVNSIYLDKTKLVWQRNQPIRIVKELNPVKLTEPKPGVFVFDLGQNMVGWCRLKVRGKAGAVVILRHGETLNRDGTIYTANLRSAEQRDRYICKSGKEEIFEPHFTYHGFRYVEVQGLVKRPKRCDLAGCVFHSAAPAVSRFESSNKMINKLMSNIIWTQRGNMHSIPTDCPQRDERLGWMGDILAFGQTAIFNMDMAAFFSKWIHDVRDGQLPDGCYPDFAPRAHWRDRRKFAGAPGWADAGIAVPWLVYQNYADVRLLKEHFESAKRWVNYIHRENPNLLWLKNRGNDYGDWLNSDTFKFKGMPKVNGAIPKELFATSFFAHSTEIVAKMAKILGHENDAEYYGSMFNKIKIAFNKAFVKSNGRIKGDTQAGYAITLRFNLLSENLRIKALKHLLRTIKEYKGHPTTGIHTTHNMMLELTRNGFNDEDCRIINLRKCPSWGYMVKQGATTIWERWDGYVKGHGFQNPDMNSFNHWAFGAVGEWVWRNIIGINPDDDQPGYKHFVIRPRPCQNFIWAHGEYDSVRGTIISKWSIKNGKFRLKVTVPSNTTATVYIPAKAASRVREGNKPAERSLGVKFLRMEHDAAIFRIGSGSYEFQVC